jgi:hypothetical protein
LLEAQPGDVARVLRPLHSVLNIPRASDGRMDRAMPITLFHLSFRDFLVGSEQNEFRINAEATHYALGMQCIRLLKSGVLKVDVCGVAAPGARRSEVPRLAVHTSLTKAVAYACCYWVQHIVSSRELIRDNGPVLNFLEEHILHWMEALSWLGKSSDIIHNLTLLQSIVDVGHNQISCPSNCTHRAYRSNRGNT